MKALKDRRPIESHQLRAIARIALQADPMITDSEWKALTKEFAAKQGYDEPPPDMLERAMTSVEKAMEQTLGPRPIRYQPTTDAKDSKPSPPNASPSDIRQGWLNVAEAITRMQGSKPSEPSSAKPNRAPVYELQLTEEKALREFWAAAGDPAIDRLNMLRIFAEIALVRPAEWDYAGVRDGAGTNPNVTLSAPNGCFSCGSRRQPLNWHHVIQVQYGGSNGLRNRVAICEPCHAAIHPWVKPVSRSVPGWFCLADVFASLDVDKPAADKKETA
jgi:hypothetical protein